MTVAKTRSALYSWARLLGDYQALASGKPSRIGKRIARRMVGRQTAKLLSALFR